MPEQDLKLICDALPATYSGDVSTQASNIYAAITGLSAEFNIGGGPQPKLYTPTLSVNGLYIVATTNNNNGGFASQSDTHVFVDDVEVTNPFVASLSDVGKTVTAVTTAQDFEDSNTVSTTITIPGVSPGFYTSNTWDTNKTITYPYAVLCFGSDTYSFIKSNTEIPSSVGDTGLQISYDGGITWSYASIMKYNWLRIAVTVVNGKPSFNLNGEVRLRVKRTNHASTVLHFQTTTAGTANVSEIYRSDMNSIAPSSAPVDNWLLTGTSIAENFGYLNSYQVGVTGWSGSWNSRKGVITGIGNLACEVYRLDTYEKITELDTSTLSTSDYIDLSVVVKPAQ